ncbi:hypothetical protein GF378_02570 [Candidatus Pacearchaeota archaeon]|nr:hypothetical protein [Candidatus Pacearchaeota archaeon]
MEKRLKSFISAILIIAGFIFLFPGLNITGAIVGVSETTGKIINSVVGVALIVIGIILGNIEDTIKELEADEKYQQSFEKSRQKPRGRGRAADEVAKEAVRYLDKIKKKGVDYEDCLLGVADIILSGTSTGGRRALKQVDYLARKVKEAYPDKNYEEIRTELSELIHNQY